MTTMTAPRPALRLRIAVFALFAATLLAAVAARASGDTAAPPHRASVRDSPGWKPLVDPESSAVRLGRRTNAPAVTMRFDGGAKSMDDLGRRICRGLQVQKRDSLLALCVTDMEFKNILWREFPQSRPVTGIHWDDAWKILYARMNAGCGHAVRDYGGHYYQFVGFESADTVQVFRNFRMHSNLVLVAKDDLGRVQRMKWLRGVVERRGSFKIYSTED
jgi:hypothetical protein